MIITIALSVPSLFDVIADFIQKKKKVYDDSQIARIVLAVSLLLTNFLFIKFSIQDENLIATYAI